MNNDHLLDKLIQNYYRICELNNKVNIIIDYTIEVRGQFHYLTFRINRKPAGSFCFSSDNECKDAVVDTYFIQGIEKIAALA